MTGISITKTILDTLEQVGLCSLIEDDDSGVTSILKDSKKIAWMASEITDSWFVICMNSDDSAIDITKLLKKVCDCDKIIWVQVSHEEKELMQITRNISVVCSTGIDDPDCGEPAMLFVIKNDNTVIGKALCKYVNYEMGAVGPTIEFFEVAKEWVNQGHGTIMMNQITNKFRDQFNPFYCVNPQQPMYVTDVGPASAWFSKFGFLFIDPPLNEEMSKHLFKKTGEKSSSKKQKRI